MTRETLVIVGAVVFVVGLLGMAASTGRSVPGFIVSMAASMLGPGLAIYSWSGQ